MPSPPNARVTFNAAESKLVGVPVGGPYTIVCEVKHESQTTTARITNVFVGDLWVLAGQSNMEGVGDLIDVTRAQSQGHPARNGRPLGHGRRAAALARRFTRPCAFGRSILTRGPLGTNPSDSQKGRRPRPAFRCRHGRSDRRAGRARGVRHGGTSMEQWNPSKKDQGGKSLYGSMLHRSNSPAARSRAFSGTREKATHSRGPRRGNHIPRCSAISSRPSALISASPSCHSI